MLDEKAIIFKVQYEIPDTHPEGSGRNSPSVGKGAPNVTATKDNAHFKSEKLMEAVVERENMKAALRRVVTNKGAPGVDGMRVEELIPYLQEKRESIKELLLHGDYIPSPVLSVEIPKAGGKGTRMSATQQSWTD